MDVVLRMISLSSTIKIFFLSVAGALLIGSILKLPDNQGNATKIAIALPSLFIRLDFRGLCRQTVRVSNVFYAPGEQRAAKVNDLFARIARRYDLLNDLQSFGLHRLWKRRVVQLTNVKSSDRALDLCCGTGDISFALAKNGAETTGLDFSPQMLEVAQSRF